MFEGKPPRPGEICPLSDSERGGEMLRPLSWNDLVARLSAARELRASLAPDHGGGEGSFDAGSARRIAAHHNGKPGVNLEDSSNGKTMAGTANGAVDGAGTSASAGAARE
jgi:hypothetical protein